MQKIKQNNQSGDWSRLLTGKNGINALSLAGGTALHATNIYLSTTILPSVIDEIGGLEYYAWNTTLFMVTSIIGSVLSRKIFHKNGARASFRLAFLIFGIGTIICALAPSMIIMLAGRAIQGFGGGIMFALAYIMIRFIFDESLWSRAFSLVSGMWGVATLLGPFIGGIFAEYNAWRYAFICLLPILFILLLLTETNLPKGNGVADFDKSGFKIPWIKIALVSISAISISIGSTSTNILNNTIGLFVALILLCIVVYLEKNSLNRLMPTNAYSLKAPIGLLFFLIALLVVSSTVEIFIPYFLQTIQSVNPFKAGFMAAFMAVGWTIGSISFSGFKLIRIKTLLLVSSILMTVAFISLSFLSKDPSANFGTPFYLLCFSIILVGLSIGIVWPHLLTLVVSNSSKGEEELSTAAITTTQLIMTSLGAAICGVIVNVFGITNPGGIEGAINASKWLYGIFTLVPIFMFFIIIFYFKKSIVHKNNQM